MVFGEGNPKRGVSIIREGTPEPNEKVQDLSQDNVLNVPNDTLDLSNAIAQGSDEELDLDNDGWDLLMNTLPKYFFFSVGSQKLRIDTKFFVQLRKKFYCSHVISNDLRVKIALKGVFL